MIMTDAFGGASEVRAENPATWKSLVTMTEVAGGQRGHDRRGQEGRTSGQQYRQQLRSPAVKGAEKWGQMQKV